MMLVLKLLCRRLLFGKASAMRLALALLACGLPMVSGAQTITITNGVQIYPGLTNTTVTMTGRCELRLTAAANVLSGCTVNLNSVDAWLFLPAVKPSAAVSTYLGQVRISGVAATADSNCRVVQYGQNGALVIPQASSFQPLTVFTGREFTGTATSYSQWTYYTGTGITNISSFRLKRGYQAVLAQSANGANYSKCYVAQDGDLEIGVLPATLEKQVQFIYVTPWRWTSKKGIAGNPPYSVLNVNWWYDWNIDQSSSRDLEYAAIRQDRWWPGLGQNWQSLGVNTVLGYNEPDNPAQANIAVGDAIWSWPDLLATGLRVGSPATRDSGRSGWLYPFVQQADAAGLRVDFVAIHYYWAWNPTDPNGAANQMYNFLLDIWNNTHRPIWITEWNNGATWTDNNPYPVPTYAQQQACVSAMMNMLESTPFVERYALYNWVDDQRSLVNSNNVVTPAGVTYSNLVSNLSYVQTMPDNGTRGLAEYLFGANTWDTSGCYNNALAVGAPAFATGHNAQAQAIVLDGANSYVQLPVNLAQGNAFSFAAWVYWNGGGNWQRIFDFGDDTSHYLFLTPNAAGSNLRFAINNGSGEQIVQSSALPSGSWQYVALTLAGANAILYVNGAAVATNSSITIAPSAFTPVKNYLGKSQFSADPLFNGKLDQVEIADYAMTAAQISARYNATQYPAMAGGIWTNNNSSAWSTTNNWNGGLVASGAGYLADFSTINLTANQTVTLDSARTIGGLRFGTPSGSQTWTLSGANTLTLDGGGANVPTIAVNQNTATVSTPLAGGYGLSKTGSGALTLNGVNSLGGGLTVNAGAVNISGGTTTFSNSTSTVGFLTGSGSLTMSGGTLALPGELRVGGSTLNGTQYVATGAVTLANATLSVGSLTVGRGNYLDNAISGTVTLNSGSTLVSTNDVIVQFAGTGQSKVALTGGNFIIGPAATKWFMLGYYDTGAAELAVTNGNLMLENGTSLKFCRNGNTGGNVVNQAGGNVTFYSDAGVTVGGGNLDLNYAGGATSTNTYNLNGGTLTVPQIIASSANAVRIFNFNGGTLKAATAGATLMAAGVANSANVRNNGARIDTAGFNVTVGQPLQHSILTGDSATDGGLIKNGAGTLTLTGTNTYTGTTTINAGTLALSGSGSITNSRAITVAGGGAVFDASAVGGFTVSAGKTLSGSGAVNGAVVNNGAVTPGTGGAIGTLTFSNSLVFNGLVSMRVNRNNGSPVNDRIALASSGINYGGTLTVNNIGSNLTAGDSFQLFSAPSYSGAFATLNLPSLGTGLAWNTNGLTNGVLSVVTTVGPQFASLAQSADGNFQFNGTGAAGVTYELDGATNLAPPIAWLFITNAVADQNGLFQLWDLSATNYSQKFYRISGSQ
ncbi:MAG TPA: LamG-like jellyroll fold domain-containing protein [Verrucomicrobiae bacterium]